MVAGTPKLLGKVLSGKSVSFGKRLSAIRMDAGLSVYALSKKSGVSQQAIARLEKGRGEPNWTTATELAKALGVPVSAFDVPLEPEPLSDIAPLADSGEPTTGDEKAID